MRVPAANPPRNSKLINFVSIGTSLLGHYPTILKEEDSNGYTMKIGVSRMMRLCAACVFSSSVTQGILATGGKEAQRTTADEVDATGAFCDCPAGPPGPSGPPGAASCRYLEKEATRGANGSASLNVEVQCSSNELALSCGCTMTNVITGWVLTSTGLDDDPDKCRCFAVDTDGPPDGTFVLRVRALCCPGEATVER